MMPIAERDVAKQGIQWLTLKGWRVLRQQSGTVKGVTGGYINLSEPGRPDYLVVRAVEPGLSEMFWWEVKRVGGKLRPAQLIWHERARHSNELVCVSDSLDALVEWYRCQSWRR